MLRGGEVTLRAVEREDLECLWRFANDLEVELAGGGDPPQPRSFESFQADFEKETRERAPDKINFAIEVDGVCIGTCGLFGLDATARHAEFGIGIGEKELWGHGYGREATGLLLDYAFHLRNLERVWLEVHSENERAIRSYRACGFVEEGRMRRHLWLAGRYVDNVIMAVLREEWEERTSG